MKKMSLNKKLAATIVILWVALIALGILGAWQNKVSMLEDRRAQLKTLTEEAFSLVVHFSKMAADKKISEEDAKKQALDMISRLRYAKDGYFAVLDSTPRMVMHPIKPSLTTAKIAGTLDPNGVKVFEVQVIAGKSSESGGFTSYSWPKPGADKPIEKLAFVKYFAPWDWHVTTGMYMDDISNALFDSALGWLAMTIFLGLITTAVMLFLLRGIKRSLGGDIVLAVENAQRISGGDLTRAVPVKKGDRSSLLFTLSEMHAGLVETVSRVRIGTENIHVGASQIAAGNADLSRRTEQQAAALVETASSMAQMTAAVKHNAESANKAAHLAGQATEVAVRGNQMVGKVIETMDRITQSSHEIEDIIGVIDAIAFQTNILALNAAVEAARAGEQGRGFAVVASEVRNLAQRSAGAAKQIKVLIQASTDTVSAGEKLVTSAGETMSEIVQSIKHVSIILDEISRASVEQSTGIDQVNRAVGDMDDVTQQNSALVEEAAAAALSLKNQAEALRSAVEAFTLPEGA